MIAAQQIYIMAMKDFMNRILDVRHLAGVKIDVAEEPVMFLDAETNEYKLGNPASITFDVESKVKELQARVDYLESSRDEWQTIADDFRKKLFKYEGGPDV